MAGRCPAPDDRSQSFTKHESRATNPRPVRPVCLLSVVRLPAHMKARRQNPPPAAFGCSPRAEHTPSAKPTPPCTLFSKKHSQTFSPEKGGFSRSFVKLRQKHPLSLCNFHKNPCPLLTLLCRRQMNFHSLPLCNLHKPKINSLCKTLDKSKNLRIIRDR